MTFKGWATLIAGVLMSAKTLGKVGVVAVMGWLLVLITNAFAAQQDPKAGPLSQLEKSWVMAHLDVETTGLLAGQNEIVDLGIVYTTVDGEILDR
jgi:DNA polymerase III alpha subunit (gram-positive type)